MKASKLLWVGALVVLLSVAGMGGFKAKQAQALHTSTKICTTFDVNVLQCTLSINNALGFIAGDTIHVTLSGPATYRVTAGVVDVVITGGCAGAFLTGVTTTHFDVNTPFFGCAGSTTITVSEKISVTGTVNSGACPPGFGGTAIVQSLASTIDPTNTGTATALGPGGQPLCFVFLPAAVNATITSKVCAPTLPDGVPDGTKQIRVGQSITCTVTLAAPGVAPTTVVVTFGGTSLPTGPGGVNPVSIPCGSVTPGGVIPCTGFTETIVPTVACGTITESINIGGTIFNLPVANAAGVLIEVLPKGSGVCPAAAGTPTAAAKVCTAQIDGVPGPSTTQFFTRVGQFVTCTVTITAGTGLIPPQGTTTVVLTNATFDAGGITTTGTFTCAIVAGTNTCTFQETFFPTVACDGTVSQTLTLAGVTLSPAVVDASGRALAVLPKAGGLCPVAAGVTGITKVCAPVPDGVPNAAIQVRVGGVVNCTVTATGAAGISDAAAQAVFPNVQFQSSPSLTGGVGTSTATFTCANQSPLSGTTCTFTETLIPTAAAVCANLGPQTVTVAGATFTVPVVTSTGAAIFVLPKPGTGIVCPGAATTLVQPFGILIECLSAVVGPFTGPIPGPIGTINVIAVGILPSALPCTATPVDAAGNKIAVAPGTIEVSAISGTLLTASGTIDTTLRIGCGDVLGLTAIGGLNPTITINVNTCLGVQFAVLGLGVGSVDLRARYEPSTFAAAAGITEVEGRATVAFVAPVVAVSLLLNPNPVAVGQTGVATARFNRTFNCAAAVGVNTAFGVAGGQVCIDPTTGLPIAFNFGSALNGTTIFSIDNTAVAAWADAVTAVPLATPQVAGFVATAAQTTRRCGFFPTVGFPQVGGTPGISTIGPLGSFFGGCESTSATYRGLTPGVTNIAATFIPDLPGAFGSSTLGLSTFVTSLLGLFGSTANPTSIRTLEVVGTPPSGLVQLVRGCNNVSPTVSESATAYAARVTPAAALVALWEHQAATNTFRGFSPVAGAPNDLPVVTRLKPVFVCVNGPATLDQPAL